MAYGTVKVDNVTFTYNAIDATTTFSGFYASTTNNLTLSGTASAVTFTGTTANFTNINAQNIGVTTSLSGLAITGNTAGFTTLTGTTVTGTTLNFSSGIFTGNSTAAAFLPTGSTVPTNGLYLSAANSVAISTNSTGRLTIDSSGNVNIDSGTVYVDAANNRLGVGTTSPGTPLDVSGIIRANDSSSDGNAGLLIATDAAARGYIGTAYWLNGGSETDIGYRVESGNNHIWMTSSTERARIDSSGTFIVKGAGTAGVTQAVSFNGSAPVNSMVLDSSGRLGIGTSSPSSPLHLSTGATALAAQFASTNTTAYNGTVYNTSRLYLLGGAGTGAYNSIGFTNYATSEGLIGFVQNTSGYGDFVIQSYAGSYSEKLRVTSAGNVGIGTTSPSRQLDVNSTAIFDAAGNGTTTNPSIAIGSTGVGLSYIGSQQLAFLTGSTERARIDSSGRLLVGTSSYSGNGKLVTAGHVGGNAGTFDICWAGSRPTAADTDIGYIRWFSADNSSSNAQYAYICASSDGASSSGNDIPGRLVFATTADGASNPTQRMIISNNGQVLVGTTDTNPYGNAVTGTAIGGIGGNGFFNTSASNQNAAAFSRMNSDGQLILFGRNGTTVGNISVTTTATAYNTSSDYRLKKNVTAVTDGIARLQQLKPIRFNFIADPNKTFDGFFAHEVQTVVPEAISGEKDAVDDDNNPIYQGIDQSKLVPLLTAALQEAIGEIESLKARVAALESA